MSWIDDLNNAPDVGSIRAYQAPKPQPKKKNFWLDQISTAGGILGGIGGSFIAPIAGTVGGSAAGSALGETLENVLTGESLGKNVAKEAALGGLFAVPPIKAGKALLGARGASQAVPEATQAAASQGATQVAKTSTKGKLTDLGNKMLTSQYGTISKPVARATRPEETIGQLADYGLTKAEDVERVSKGLTGADGILNKAVVKAVGRTGGVNTDGIQQIFDDAIENVGLVEKDRKQATAIFRGQMKRLMGGAKGSLSSTSNPNDVLDVMKALESRIADLGGKGGNYRLTTPDRSDQAKVLQAVRDDLEERLFQTAQASNSLESVLTPKLRKQLIDLSPNNGQWQNFIDNTVFQSKDIGGLRSAQAPFVRASQIIDEGDVNSITFGGRVGNATQSAGGLVGGIIDPVTGALAGAAQSAGAEPVKRAAGNALRSIGNSTPGAIPRPVSRMGIAARVGAGGLVGGGINQLSQMGQSPPSTLEDAMLTNQFSNDLSQPERQTSPYSRENLLLDVQRDPQNADKYLDYYTRLQEVFNPKQEGSDLTSGQQDKAVRAQNAMGDIEILANAINTGDITKTAIPGSNNAFIGNALGTSDIEAALFNIGDVILRSRTGATAPDAEIRAFVNGFLPRAGESRESQLYKLQRAQRELQGMINPATTLEEAVI